MAGLIVPPMWGGASARYHQTPPEPPSADGPAHLKHHTHQRQRKIPPIIPDWPRIPHCTTEVWLFIDSFCSSQRLRRRWSHRRRLKQEVCAAAPRRGSAPSEEVSHVRSGLWVGGGGGLWVLCWVMKQVSLTSEVCGDRTGLRSVWTTVRQEGGVSTGSFCSWHHRGRSQPHWAMGQEGLIRFRLQKQICFRYSVWFFCRLRSPLAYATS